MDEENSPVLVFDDYSKTRIFKSLGLSENTDCELVDEKGLIQTNQDFEVIHSKDFGGVLKGSKVMIKKDVVELVRFFAQKESE